MFVIGKCPVCEKSGEAGPPICRHCVNLAIDRERGQREQYRRLKKEIRKLKEQLAKEDWRMDRDTIKWIRAAERLHSALSRANNMLNLLASCETSETFSSTVKDVYLDCEAVSVRYEQFCRDECAGKDSTDG